MATYKDDEHPSCPFCTFHVDSDSERDVYFLMQHLELSHPENGESPFIARDASPSRWPSSSRSSSRSRQPAAGASRSRSVTPSLEDGGEDFYIECPADCGEAIHIRELQDHMDLHEIEGLAADYPRQPNDYGTRREASPYRAIGSRSTSSERRGSRSLLEVPGEEDSSMGPGSQGRSKRTRETTAFGSLKDLLLGPAPRKTRPAQQTPKPGTVRRLGKTELGPHAFEEQMPAWLYKQLERGARVTVVNEISYTGQFVRVEKVANETPGMIPVLAQLCQQDSSLSKVFLCHPSVKHIFKTPKEGGFCGYRNIQMLVSFITGTRSFGHEHFPGPTPSIPRLQDMIENAWDQGIHSSSRIETGGIKGTRKYIGTPEAQALFCSLDIDCDASAFNKPRDRAKRKDFVHDHVLEAVLEYFSQGVTDPLQKVYQTGLAPIYFQHPGHSLTIVGLEVRKSGAMNLLVLDPMFKTAPGITGLIGTRFHAPLPEKLLKAYRRGDSYLGKYHSFELLKLVPPIVRRDNQSRAVVSDKFFA